MSSSSARNTMNKMSFRERWLSCSQRSSASSLRAMAPGLGCGARRAVRGREGPRAPQLPGLRLRPARPPEGRSRSPAHPAEPDRPGRPTLGSPVASASSPAPALPVHQAHERRRGRIPGASRLPTALAGPPSPPEPSESVAGPRAPCTTSRAPAFPGRPGAPRAAPRGGVEGGLPLPSAGPRSPPSPGGALFPARSRVGRELGRCYLGRSAAACPGRCGLRLSGRLRVTVSSPAPHRRLSVYRVRL